MKKFQETSPRFKAAAQKKAKREAEAAKKTMRAHTLRHIATKPGKI